MKLQVSMHDERDFYDILNLVFQTVTVYYQQIL